MSAGGLLSWQWNETAANSYVAPANENTPRLLPQICQGLHIVFVEEEEKFVYEWLNKDSMRRTVGKRKIQGAHPIN